MDDDNEDTEDDEVRLNQEILGNQTPKKELGQFVPLQVQTKAPSLSNLSNISLKANNSKDNSQSGSYCKNLSTTYIT